MTDGSSIDWTTAEALTKTLTLDTASRLSTLPRDIVDILVLYLHTWVDVYVDTSGIRHRVCRRDNHRHGLAVASTDTYTTIRVYRDDVLVTSIDVRKIY